ncbi:tRNA (adenosine(37)-N6)-threonylcarbamoyltransferase complex transferase subunit TsaD [candidate division KSB1 bacterium]|nr:tRNA (adenosine(37)-N6)-threonylcarbamoyltransferase complex transferase subunit TsaD [candidate division KSB1 bacterium]
MLVLGIETSCDETSAAVVDKNRTLSNIVATQTEHIEFGGVVPEFASRAHIRQLPTIVRMALKKADVQICDLDGCAVTYGPGLAGSLLIGLLFCKGLAQSLKIPWIGINHLEGHIMAVAAEKAPPDFPYLALVVSGGHTLLVKVENPLQYEIVGRTIDDAAGEAFDKTAKILGLGYPGGPIIERHAKNGNGRAIDFPRAMLDKNHLDFSFSGLKTAVLYYAQSLSTRERQDKVDDIAASFQQAVIDVLVEKSMRALERFKIKNFILSGGVARNSTLRDAFSHSCRENQIDFRVPAPELCTDNAAMIARVGHIRLQRGEFSANTLDVKPNLSL